MGVFSHLMQCPLHRDCFRDHEIWDFKCPRTPVNSEVFIECWLHVVPGTAKVGTGPTESRGLAGTSFLNCHEEMKFPVNLLTKLKKRLRTVLYHHLPESKETLIKKNIQMKRYLEILGHIMVMEVNEGWHFKIV